MKWPFRRNFAIFKGVRINFGKRGASFSLGSRGLSPNFGRRGTGRTVRQPRSGLSYSTRLGMRSSGARTVSSDPRPTPNSAPAKVAPTSDAPSLNVPGDPGARPELDDNGVLQIKKSDGESMTEDERTDFVNIHRQQVVEWLRAKATVLEGKLELARAAPERPDETPASMCDVIVAKPPQGFAELLPEPGPFTRILLSLSNAVGMCERAARNCQRMEDWRQRERERWRDGNAHTDMSNQLTLPLSEAGQMALRTRVQTRLDEWLRTSDIVASVEVKANEDLPETAISLRVRLERLHLLPYEHFSVDIEKPGLIVDSLSVTNKKKVLQCWAQRALAIVLPSVFRASPIIESLEVHVEAALIVKEQKKIIDVLQGKICCGDYVVHFIGWDGDELPLRWAGDGKPMVTCNHVPEAFLRAL